MKRILPYFIASALYAFGRTFRIRFHDDPRPGLTEQGYPQIFAALHAHQLAAIIGADRGTATLVSRSKDGDMIAKAIAICGMVPIRGSAGDARKGGSQAAREMVKHLGSDKPVAIAVDGPAGPRGHVKQGVGLLAAKTGAVVVPAVVLPSRRWIIAKTWDRIQIPKPFCTVNVHFAEPLFIAPDESNQDFAARVEIAFRALEMQHDPAEATLCHSQPKGKRNVNRAA